MEKIEITRRLIDGKGNEIKLIWLKVKRKHERKKNVKVKRINGKMSFFFLLLLSNSLILLLFRFLKLSNCNFKLQKPIPSLDISLASRLALLSVHFQQNDVQRDISCNAQRLQSWQPSRRHVHCLQTHEGWHGIVISVDSDKWSFMIIRMLLSTSSLLFLTC